MIALGVRRGCIFAHLFVRSRLLVCRCEVINAFYWGTGDDIKYYISILDYTGALDRRIA